MTSFEPWSSLPGKVVLVTGASSGIGREFCLNLAKAGCQIIAAARRLDKLKSLCDEINGYDNDTIASHDQSTHCCQAAAIELDITSDGQVIDEHIGKAWATFGHIDVLINNAGFRGNVKSSIDICEEEWNLVMKTNITGTWQVSKCVARRMESVGRGGSIINISSVTGLNRVQFHGGIAYNSSKSAVDSITKVLALELEPHNIRVNGIAPGLFWSEITKLLFKRDLRNVVNKMIPLDDLCPTDPALTSLIRYLIHESSNYVTGNIFIVDGGLTLLGLPIYSSL